MKRKNIPTEWGSRSKPFNIEKVNGFKTLTIYQIYSSNYWQARMYLEGKIIRKSTKVWVDDDKKTAIEEAKKIYVENLKKLKNQDELSIKLERVERKIMQDELEKESEGKIYIIGIKEEEDQEIREVKIGFTKVSAQSRKGQMQTGIPKKLDIIYESIKFPYASVYEKKYLFSRLANRNIAREWFKLSDDEIVDLINEIEEDSEICFDIGKTYLDTGKKIINGTFNSIYLEKSKEFLFPEDERYTDVAYAS